MEVINKNLIETKNQIENDLYTGYNDYNPLLDSKGLQYDPSFQQAVLSSSYNNKKIRNDLNSLNEFSMFDKNLINKTYKMDSRRSSTSNISQTAQSSRTLKDNCIRPLTGVKAAGYTRNILTSDNNLTNVTFDPFNQSRLMNSSDLSKQQEVFVGMTKIKIFQNKVETLYQQSVLAAQNGNKKLALEKAKICVSRERALNRLILDQQQKQLNTENISTISYSSNLSLDLQLAIQVNLALQLTNSQMYNEALDVYESIIKNKKILNSGRFKCNMAVIYFLQKKFRKAIKFFQMALDQMPSTQIDLRMKIMRNIALCFVSMGKYQDAVSSFEYILSEKPLCTDAFRMLICNYAMNDINLMKNSFIRLLELCDNLFINQFINYRISNTDYNQQKFETFSFLDLQLSDEEDLDEIKAYDENFLNKNKLENMDENSIHRLSKSQLFLNNENTTLFKRILRNDPLSIIFNEKLKQRNWYILTASKLISNRIAPTIDQGFSWCSECIQSICNSNSETNSTINLNNMNLQKNQATNFLNDIFSNNQKKHSFNPSKKKFVYELIIELQLACADYHLRERQFESAITILSTFEHLGTDLDNTHNKLWSSKCTALTNLSYIHLLEHQFTNALKYCDLILDLDHYHIGALVNKGCCLLQEGQYEKSRIYFSEALLHEPHCIQAIYNLGLANRRLGYLENALDLFLRLNTLIQSNEYCFYQIAIIYEQLNDLENALNWYEQLLSIAPHDLNLLNHLSDLLESNGNKNQVFIYLNDSIRQDPSHIPTIERLAVYYIELKAYEKAIFYLEKASKIQKNQIKWILMVGACYKRIGDLRQAFQKYQSALKKFPENIQCLKHLINLSRDLNLIAEYEKYMKQLNHLEKVRDLREKYIQSANNLNRNKNSSNSQTISNRLNYASRENSTSSLTNSSQDRKFINSELENKLNKNKIESSSSFKSLNGIDVTNFRKNFISINSRLSSSSSNKLEIDKNYKSSNNNDNLNKLNYLENLQNLDRKNSNLDDNIDFELNNIGGNNFNLDKIHLNPSISCTKKTSLNSDQKFVDEFTNEDLIQILP